MFLYVVATPIGNLGDISYRAVEILKSVDYIICEDTRVSGKLLNHLSIKKPKIIFTTHTEIKAKKKILDLLEKGKNLALISDAGTPCLSDPGSTLISDLREKNKKIKIITIPGASALTAAISIIGLNGGEFFFKGFLPNKKGRKKNLEKLSLIKEDIILFESKHRIIKLLEELNFYLPKRTIFIARELTKIHEEICSGQAQELLLILRENPLKLKGEMVIIIKK